jgi:hypothetical protein
MGRHTDAATTSMSLRRTAQLSGLTGGLAWVAASFLGDGGLADVLLLVGVVLLTVALVGLGLLLVKSDVLPLRLFVAVAVPTLVWGVLGLLRDAATASVVDTAFGAVVAMISAVLLARHPQRRRATL